MRTHPFQVSVIGQSGSGISVLGFSLLQMADVPEGEIQIDGVDVQSVSGADLRSRVGLITVEPLMLQDTVRYSETRLHSLDSEPQN